MLFHEVLAAVIAIGYAVMFWLVDADGSLWLWGALGGLIHYTLAGPVVAAIPSIDPETGEVGKQGFAYRNYGGLDVFTSFIGHLSFGVLTGILYGFLQSGGGSGLAF
jgi:hypothetical protein